ncbi:hypothetical protein [Chromobacterium haemolyticum]|uniref:hypothetical protein n=1 Tax=Chromobacterium haemolyticum TaxID=394935 RepID=UPI0012F7F464|nr:hypothetical protein [Chromobacterium haemolyticum]
MAMSRGKTLLALLCALPALPAWSLQMAPLLELDADKSEMRVELKNDSRQPHDYRVSLRPLAGLESSFGAAEDVGAATVAVAPARLTLRAGASGAIKLRYRGAAMETRERYYRLLVEEATTAAAARNVRGAGAWTDYPVSLGSVLIVRPRAAYLDFHLEGGVLRNTGNAAFWLLQDEACGGKTGSTKIQTPGSAARLAPLTGRSLVRVGLGDEIRVVLDQCGGKSG